MSKAIILVRVSTEQQTIEAQEKETIELACSEGFKKDDLIFIIKIGESAIKKGEIISVETPQGTMQVELDRDSIAEMKNYILNDSEITTVYCWELSRLGRRISVLTSLIEFFEEHNIQLRILTPSLSLKDANGEYSAHFKTMITLWGQMSENEMKIKKERFERGRRELAEQNRFNGGRIPFGYTCGENNIIEVDENGDAIIVRLIFELYSQGNTCSKIAEILKEQNVPLPPSHIGKILKNESYTGKKMKTKGSTYERQYPQIISVDKYAECRNIARNNNTTASKTRNIYYAESLVYCPTCGSKWSASGSKVCYHCYSAYASQRIWNTEYGSRKEKCTDKTSLSINVLDSILWQLASELEADFIISSAEEQIAKYAEAIEKARNKINVINKDIEKIEVKKDRIQEDYYEQRLTKDKYLNKLKAIQSEKNNCQTKKNKFEEEILRLNSLIEECQKSTKYADEFSEWEKKDKLIDKIRELQDDKERQVMIKNRILEVSVRPITLKYKFGIGWRPAKAKEIIVNSTDGKSFPLIHIPNNGKGGIVLYNVPLPQTKKTLDEHEIDTDELSNIHSIQREEDKEPILVGEFLYTYLNRFTDKKKNERREREKTEKYKEVQSWIRLEEGAKKYNVKYNYLYNHAIIKKEIVHKKIARKTFLCPNSLAEFFKKKKEN